MTTMLEFAPFWRSSIGFDHLFDMIEEAMRSEPNDNYPPFNIEKTGDDAYRITLAVAGYSPDELSVTNQQNLLVVSGSKAERKPTEQYLYQGIAGRAFERQFNLADHVKVTGADLSNGLLVIDLVREVPEAMRPRRIDIAHGSPPRAIERKQAA
jgi:molecular chaperone IbpA